MKPLNMAQEVQEYDLAGYINLSMTDIIDTNVKKFNLPTSSMEDKLKYLDIIEQLLNCLIETCKHVRKYSLSNLDTEKLDSCDVYLETIQTIINNEHSRLTSTNRAMTAEEIAEWLVSEIRSNVVYCAKEHPNDSLRACELTAFSILTMLDGARPGIPSFKLTPNVDEEWVRDQQEAGENWIEPGTVINEELHDYFHKPSVEERSRG